MVEKTDYPKRLKRAESFLGIHFDFHAGDDCKEIGKGVTREMIERVIDQIQPDYIQCDCKGHRGLSSYPTKVGNPAPGFVKDQLRIWRDVTAERGVSLFMHYSGVFDIEAVTKHPTWAAIDAKGKRNKQQTSVFGPYVDKLLIPQLKELSDVYGVDGVWVDGECWATVADYGKKAVQAFREKTGIETVPKTPEDPHYWDYLEFCREGFRDYLRHYVDELHKHNPDFQIASNWAFTSQMPEPVSADVDFISGDYPLQDSFNMARMEARCIANQGKPWDLVAWAFSGKWGEGVWTTKAIDQLKQEAAVVLAIGGGFQAYFTQKRDASIRDWQVKLMSEVAKFCRERQSLCHKAKAVPQVALLLSGAGYYHHKEGLLIAPWASELTALSGTLNALLDGQNSVEIVMEHHITGHMSDYPVIVVPEWSHLDPKFIDELKSYVKSGGNLLLIGCKSAKLFETELDIRLQGEPEDATRWLEHDGWFAGNKCLFQPAKLGKKARQFGTLHTDNDGPSPSDPAAVITDYGAGKIAGVFMNLGSRYKDSRTTVTRDFISAIVRELFPNPIVELTGSHYVDVIVNRQNGKLAINLINSSGPHHDGAVHTFDEITPIGPLDIKIRLPKKPTKITREPAGESLNFTYEDGQARLTLDRLEIHDILTIE